LKLGDEIIIRESDRQAKLIFTDPNYFFHNLSSRLSW
jgi:NAD kinase